MRLLLSFLFIMTSMAGFAQKQFVVDPDAEVRIVSGAFSSIRVSNGIHLYISKGDAEAVAVSGGDEKDKMNIKTEIQNGELSLSYAGDRNRFGKDRRINVYVAFRNLEQLTITGASNVLVAGLLEMPQFDLQLSGASEFKGDIKIGTLNARLGGASDMKLSGAVTHINIESSGASDVKAYELTAETCNAKASGASDINITVTKEITANASGASDILYRGPAEIKKKQSSGASTIAKRD